MAVELVVVGGGRMGEALVEGLLASRWGSPEQMVVVERDETRRSELRAGLAQRHRGLRVEDNVPPGAGAVVAVKPADVATACIALRASGARRVVSIAAGVSLARLEGWLHPPGSPGSAPAVLRAMPNTAALLRSGASGLAPGSTVEPEDLAWGRGILEAVGVVVILEEHHLDAVTGLSGSGPAYLFLVAEALIDAGVLAGLPRPVAVELTIATMVGSGRLLAESGRSPAELRAEVTSPGGTTAAGLRVLEAGALRGVFLDAVAAATARAGELGSAHHGPPLAETASVPYAREVEKGG